MGQYFLNNGRIVQRTKDPIKRSDLAVSQSLTFIKVQFMLLAVNVKSTKERETLEMSE